MGNKAVQNICFVHRSQVTQNKVKTTILLLQLILQLILANGGSDSNSYIIIEDESKVSSYVFLIYKRHKVSRLHTLQTHGGCFDFIVGYPLSVYITNFVFVL